MCRCGSDGVHCDVLEVSGSEGEGEGCKMAQLARDAIPKHERARESGGARPVVSDNTGPETAKEGAMGAVARKASEAVGARMNATAERWWDESDAMHALLIKRCDELMGCTEGSPEEKEL